MEKEYLLSSWICTALIRIGTKMATGFDQHFAGLGLTQAQFRILLAIFESGAEKGISPSLLADLLLIERGTVSVLTNRMIARGWLARKPGENRRTYQLLLTEAGLALLQEAIPRAISLADYTLSGISTHDLRQLRASLEMVEERLRDYAPPQVQKNVKSEGVHDES